MPELPEVETVRRDLTRVLRGKKITALEIRWPRIIEGATPKFRRALVGQTIRAVKRRGKLLILQLSSDNFLLFHLKMTGQLIFCQHQTFVAGGHHLPHIGTLPNKWTHLIIRFGRGVLYFNDQRRFGYARIVSPQQLATIEKQFGPEPLAAHFTAPIFTRIFTGRHTSVKALLLNQKLLAGVGNIYADEICFAARVRPQRRASSLTTAETQALFRATKKILRRALQLRGTTFSDYVDGGGKNGGYARQLKVYGRAAEHCRRCRGIIQKTRAAGRGTHFCPQCQK